jgi:hypothetical protein
MGIDQKKPLNGTLFVSLAILSLLCIFFFSPAYSSNVSANESELYLNYAGNNSSTLPSVFPALNVTVSQNRSTFANGTVPLHSNPVNRTSASNQSDSSSTASTLSKSYSRVYGHVYSSDGLLFIPNASVRVSCSGVKDQVREGG